MYMYSYILYINIYMYMYSDLWYMVLRSLEMQCTLKYRVYVYTLVYICM